MCLPVNQIGHQQHQFADIKWLGDVGLVPGKQDRFRSSASPGQMPPPPPADAEHENRTRPRVQRAC